MSTPTENHRIVSRGTYGWKRQPGSSYPEAYYGYNIPMENQFFKEYLEKKNITMNNPLSSGHAFSSSYAPAGGVTEADMIQRCNLRRGCHPQLPARQNQTSYILDSNLDFRLCPYGEQEDIGLFPEEEETVISEEVGITAEEMQAMDQDLATVAGETGNLNSVNEIKTSDIQGVQAQNNSSIWLALGTLIFLSFYFSRK